jgi:predicted kinase
MAVRTTRKKFYTITARGAEDGHQLVLGYREALNVARDIASRGHTVIVRNEADMLTWVVEPHGPEVALG